MLSLERACGLPLSIYREEHLAKQLQAAMRASGAASLGELARIAAADEQLRRQLRRGVANSLSGPFRDPEQFELLEHDLLPPVLAGRSSLRIWSAGCADGSELFSLATVLGRLGAADDVHLLGSDILTENLELARASAAERPAATASRLRWERRDLVGEGAPAGRWDLILCRNVAIYLRPEARQRLHATLAAALAPAGLLLLGRSERLPAPASLGLREAGPHAYRREA